MAKRHIFEKAKPGEPILVTARQLESFMLEHNGRFYTAVQPKSYYRMLEK
jgi:hypothetical protein